MTKLPSNPVYPNTLIAFPLDDRYAQRDVNPKYEGNIKEKPL